MKKMIVVLSVLILSNIAFAGFVSVNGTQFVHDGKPFYYAGANSYYLFYKPWNQVEEVINDTKAMNLSVIRTWGFCAGPKKDGYGFLPQPGVYDEATFQRMDRIIKEAGDHGIKLMVPFENNWVFSGGSCQGMCQYVKWCNITNSDLCDPNAGPGSAGAAAHDEFYTNNCTREIYKRYVTYFLNRTNTLTGVKYKDDPAIFAWQLANEPRARSDQTGQVLYNWVSEMSTHIKSIDSNHLLTTGEDGFYLNKGSNWKYNGYDGQDFISHHQIPTIDFASYHLYLWDISFNQSLDWIDEHSYDAQNIIGKPATLNEFGYSKPLRDSYMQGWYDALEKAGNNGDTFWMLCDNLFPDSDGLCVYYPTDNTTSSIITAHAKRMKSANFTNSADNTINCTFPVGGMNITSHVVLCTGVYNMTGPLNMMYGSGLDCNGSTLVGNQNITGINMGSNSVIKNCILDNYASGIVGYHNYGNLAENNTITNSQIGFNFHDVKYSKFLNNTLRNGYRGFSLWWGTDYNLFENNTVRDNSEGFWFDWISDHNIFRKNTVYNNSMGFYHPPEWYGWIYNNTFTQNNVENNTYGFYLGASVGFVFENNIIKNNYDGIFLEKSHNNTIERNNIMNNYHGNYIYGENNTFYQNDLINNDRGIEVYGTNNSVYHNNFINNTIQAYYPSNDNFWDKNSEGNYWSNYDEPSEGCIDANSDDICDSPYIIFMNVNDSYPFIQEYGWCLKIPGDTNRDRVVDIFDLAAVGLCFDKPPVGSCTNTDINRDSRIDIFDLATVGLHFGWSC